ncbi:MAG: hypothetical protein EXR36_13500 [Betaproteobacteria bacterium]|nr:hypothetical protein [Betaproteobacteria bacterium]
MDEEKSASPGPDDLMREVQKLRSALEGAHQRIGELQSVITRIAPEEPLAKLEVPLAKSSWWERAGVAQDGSAPAEPAEVPSYFGMEGVWVPGKVAEVENLDEVLSEMDLEDTYANVTPPPR